MKYRYKIVLIVAPLVLILDQLTKWLVVNKIPFGSQIAVIPGYFDIVHTKNFGAAFGMMANVSSSFRIPFFYIVAGIAVVVIALMLWKMRDDCKLMPFAFALIFGGIAGNIIDRIRYGSVVDYVSFHWKEVVLSGKLFGWRINLPLDWPAFNIADSAITVAMALLIIAAFKKPVGGGERLATSARRSVSAKGGSPPAIID